MIKGFVWVRPFVPERMVDGDTVHGLVYMDETVMRRPKKGVRITYPGGYEYDAPEMKDDPIVARQALRVAAALLVPGVPVVSATHRVTEDGYGRMLMSLTLPDGRDYAMTMAELGHVKSQR